MSNAVEINQHFTPKKGRLVLTDKAVLSGCVLNGVQVVVIGDDVQVDSCDITVSKKQTAITCFNVQRTVIANSRITQE